jgi:aspartyl/asparaginyl beta-hydroxylase (cupin superfamily)
MANDKPKTARSYRTGIIDDNFSLHINIKWLMQLCMAVAGIIYGYVQITSRIAELERRVELADTSIEELVNKHMIKEEKERAEMEERISFFEKELNLNPFSWKRKKK